MIHNKKGTKKYLVFLSFFLYFIMFQYSNITHSPVNNNEPIKIADFQQVTTSYPTHYHYDPEFYHQSTTTPWQQPIYPEVPPTDYTANNQILTKPRVTTSVWDDEGTVCYQVDVRGICVARRQGNQIKIIISTDKF